MNVDVECGGAEWRCRISERASRREASVEAGNLVVLRGGMCNAESEAIVPDRKRSR